MLFASDYVLTSVQTKLNPTLKDLDFTEIEEKILVGREAKEKLLKMLEADAMVRSVVHCRMRAVETADQAGRLPE